MANKSRGEVTITIGGKTLTARPTFQAIASIEGALGVGAFALGQKCVQGQMGVAEMATVLHHGIRAVHKRGEVPNVSDLGEMLMEEGMEDFIAPVGDFLLRAFSGTKETAPSDDSEGEPKPTPQD